MTVRAARAEDARGIAEVVRDSYRLRDAHHIPFDMPNYHPEYHAAALAEPDTRWRLVVEQGVPVGVAMWRVLDGLAHLHLLFVRADRQGHGYGSRLLKEFQEEARRERPDTRLYTLHCLRDSQWAMRFYSRHGFTLYQPGDEGRVTDLYIWIDSCRRHDNGWPLRPDKALFYRRAVG